MVHSNIHEVQMILAEQRDGASSLLAVLEEVQSRYRYLPRDSLILVSERLDIPLTTVTLLFTLNSAAGLATTAVAGPVSDRIGRKGSWC